MENIEVKGKIVKVRDNIEFKFETGETVKLERILFEKSRKYDNFIPL